LVSARHCSPKSDRKAWKQRAEYELQQKEEQQRELQNRTSSSVLPDDMEIDAVHNGQQWPVQQPAGPFANQLIRPHQGAMGSVIGPPSGIIPLPSGVHFQAAQRPVAPVALHGQYQMSQMPRVPVWMQASAAQRPAAHVPQAPASVRPASAAATSSSSMPPGRLHRVKVAIPVATPLGSNKALPVIPVSEAWQNSSSMPHKRLQRVKVATPVAPPLGASKVLPVFSISEAWRNSKGELFFYAQS